MGLEILGTDAAAAVMAVVSSPTEAARRAAIRRRVWLYRDHYQPILRQHISEIFVEPTVQHRLQPFVPLVGGTSFLKRICDELARPLYAREPVRRVLLPGQPIDSPAAAPAQEAYSALAREMCLSAQLDVAARLLVACNAVFLFLRYVGGVGLCCDVLTPDLVSVVPHPSCPTRALAIAYTVAESPNGRPLKYVVWDNRRYFELDRTGSMSRLTPHNLGRMPFVEIHRRGRLGTYWDSTTGSDLEAATLFAMLMDLITARKLKAQSHIQLAYSGESDGFVKDQVSDEESILMSNGGGTLIPINLESDPSALLNAKLATETTVASNYGISRERLNQKTGDVGEDVALKERVAELAHAMVHAEHDVFEIVKSVSAEHPVHSIPAEATLLVDLGQLHNRVDRKTQLDIRREEKSQGIRSAVDDVLEDNPEFCGNRTLAMAFIREKMGEEAIVVEARRTLNAPADASPDTPGQVAAANGAMGPAVRDGAMSRDEAAEQARTGAHATTSAEPTTTDGG